MQKFKILIQDKYVKLKDITFYAKIYVAITISIIVLIVFFSSTKTIVVNKVKYLPQETKFLVIRESNSFSKKKFIDLIIKSKIKYPHIVYAQAWKESRFNSNIFLENHNMLGMKMPGRRPTLAIGVNRGHAVFRNWKECFYDYIIFQQGFIRHINNEEEYYLYLKSYAPETPSYPGAVKKLADKFKPLFTKKKKKKK